MSGRVDTIKNWSNPDLCGWDTTNCPERPLGFATMFRLSTSAAAYEMMRTRPGMFSGYVSGVSVGSGSIF